MHLRRTLALASGALLLSGTLSSCSMEMATDRVNNVSAAANNRDASVDVLGALVVSAEEGSGTFVATFVNNDRQDDATVESVEPATGSDDEDQVSAVDWTPVSVEPNSMVNLAQDDQGVPVEGEFTAGDVVPLTVQISGGQLVELEVPVVPNCGDWAGIDGPGGDCELAEPVGEH